MLYGDISLNSVYGDDEGKLLVLEKFIDILLEADSLFFGNNFPILLCEGERALPNKTFKIDWKNECYLIHTKNLLSEINEVLFFPSICKKRKEVSTDEKLTCLWFYEARKTFVEMYDLDIFTPEMTILDSGLRDMFDFTSFFVKYKKGAYLLPFEKKEFDAQFVSRSALYYLRKGYLFNEIADIVSWQPI